MGLSAEECCRTIGCNCAGTQVLEMFNKIPLWLWCLIALGLSIIITFITFRKIKGVVLNGKNK